MGATNKNAVDIEIVYGRENINFVLISKVVVNFGKLKCVHSDSETAKQPHKKTGDKYFSLILNYYLITDDSWNTFLTG